MARQVPDEGEIETHTRALLERADAKGRFPTPVDDILAAAGLTQPKDSLLSDVVLSQAPLHLRRAMRKLTGKVRAVLDRKAREIHIDPSIHNVGRANFHKLHEVGHDIYPWQRALGYADDDGTFSPSVKTLFEQEANIGASHLLFQHEHFDDLARRYAIGHASIEELAGVVGASFHATFRRFVNATTGVAAGVVMDLSPCCLTPLEYRRHEVVISQKWAKQFGDNVWPRILRRQPYSFISSAESARTSGGVVQTSFALPNLRNEAVPLRVELYSNQYVMFALIWKDRRETLRRRRIIA